MLADMLGHNGEALALLDGTGCLDCSIESKQVALVGKLIDRRNDRANRLGLLRQRQDRLGDALNPRPDMGPYR